MSATQKLARIRRLQGLEEGKRDIIQRELADAERAVRSATELCEAAHAAYEAARDEPLVGITAADFADRRGHIDSLARQSARAAHTLALARRQADAVKTRALEAQRGVRKMELWGEHVAAGLAASRARSERLGTDELAAAMSLRGQMEGSDE